MLLWAAAALADPTADWRALYEARFVEIADGTPGNAVLIYQATLLDRDPGAPLFSTTAFWLGRAQLAMVLIPEAQASLRAAAAEPASRGDRRAIFQLDAGIRDSAAALLEEMALDAAQVSRLPAAWDFSAAALPAVGGWRGDGDDRVGIEAVDGQPALRWTASLDRAEPPRLTLRFGGATNVREIGFRARAGDRALALRVVVVDEWGDRWSSPRIPVGEGAWTAVTVDVRDLEPAGAAIGPRQLGRVVDVRLEATQPGAGDEPGSGTLFLDDVTAS